MTRAARFVFALGFGLALLTCAGTESYGATSGPALSTKKTHKVHHHHKKMASSKMGGSGAKTK